MRTIPFMKQPPSNLPHHLRAWRQHSGLTLEQTANMLGVKENSLSDKELGKRPVTTEELTKLAEIYGCEPWMLLAADPNSEKLSQIRRARDVINTLPPNQTDAWLNMGETLASPDKQPKR